MESKEIVERGTILRATVGSTIHGLHHGGQDDRDEMAVYVEPPEFTLGLRAGARDPRRPVRLRALRRADTARGRPLRPGRPRPGRLLAAQVRAARAQGAPDDPAARCSRREEFVHVETELGKELRALRPKLLSRLAGRGYLGYLHGQKERLLGSRGQKRVNRPELVEAHGYDTKYAMHAARLGYQGLELLETGELTLPMPEPERSRVMAIRTGERTFEQAIAEIDEVEARLAQALERSPLPERPDRAAVDGFLVDATAAPGAGSSGRGHPHTRGESNA